jgi:hypothetical protein
LLLLKLASVGGLVNKKLWNWRLWVGFTVAVLALVVYVVVFWSTRDVLWVSLALFVVSAIVLAAGLRRSFGRREAYRGQVAGPILAGCSALILVVFGLASNEVSKHFPAAHHAPKVGQAAPEFKLVNTAGKSVTLADVLSEPVAQAAGAHAPKGVLLVFYRSHW